MPDVVFDTVIFLRSLLNPNGACAEIVFSRGDVYRLVVSGPIVAELIDVLERPALVKRFDSLTRSRREVIMRLVEDAFWVELAEIEPVCRDPKDDVFIAKAVAGGASFLVSEDRDLLDLGAYEAIQIVDASAFLQSLGDLS